MSASSPAIASAPAHPQPAQNEPAAVDDGHPQLEPVAREEVADQGQRGDTEADRDKGIAEPQAGNDVDQHEIDLPERAQLPRREMAKPAAKHAERDEQQECRKVSDIEGAHALAGVIDPRD